MSDKKQMPGGIGAGTCLGLFMFLILFNGAGPDSNSVSIGKQITESKRRRKPIEKSKVKWIDDMTCTVSVNLKSALVPDTRPSVCHPVPFHARTGHMLPVHLNPLQAELDKVKYYTDQNLMSVNQTKTKTMIFNRRKKWDVMPELSILPGEYLEVVDEMKIVGYMFRSDLKTVSNTRYITARAYKRLWMIRRLKALGASHAQLIDVLQKQVLSLLHIASPAWNVLLTEKERCDIERVLHTAMHIIWGPDYQSFESAIEASNISTLEDQRNKMDIKFCQKTLKHPKFRQWFNPTHNSGVSTRRLGPRYKPVPARTSAFARSPIPAVTALANSLPLQTWE